MSDCRRPSRLPWLHDSAIDIERRIIDANGGDAANQHAGALHGRLSFGTVLLATMQRTSMLIGGVTAVGIADAPIYIDSAVMRTKEVVMGGGNRSSKLLLNPQELLKLPHVEVIDGLAKPKD